MFDYTLSELSKPIYHLRRIGKPYRRYRPPIHLRIPEMIEFSRSITTDQVQDIEKNKAVLLVWILSFSYYLSLFLFFVFYGDSDVDFVSDDFSSYFGSLVDE